MNSKELQAALLKMEIDNENKVGEVTKAIKKESNKKTKVNIESILSEIELSKIIVDMLDHETCDLKMMVSILRFSLKTLGIYRLILTITKDMLTLLLTLMKN